MEKSEFWTGWESALDSLETALKEFMAQTDVFPLHSTEHSIIKSAYRDCVLDLKNVVKDLRGLEPKEGIEDLTISAP